MLGSEESPVGPEEVKTDLQPPKMKRGGWRAPEEHGCIYCKLDAKTALRVHDAVFIKKADISTVLRRYYQKFADISIKGAVFKFQPRTKALTEFISRTKRAILKHYSKGHQPLWLQDYDDWNMERKKDSIFVDMGITISKLGLKLVNGKISDEDYIEKVKLVSFSNMIANPQKVSVRQGLEAIKLGIEKQKIGVQQSESMRNWMKLLSGLPDKQEKPVDMGTITEIKPIPITKEADFYSDTEDPKAAEKREEL